MIVVARVVADVKNRMERACLSVDIERSCSRVSDVKTDSPKGFSQSHTRILWVREISSTFIFFTVLIIEKNIFIVVFFPPYTHFVVFSFYSMLHLKFSHIMER